MWYICIKTIKSRDLWTQPQTARARTTCVTHSTHTHFDSPKNNHRLAQELLQETLSQITHNAIAYNTVESFITHACKVMTRTHRTTMREADIHELHQLCYTPHGTPCTPAEIIHAMSRLTPQQATVITLRLKGYSHSQIARATGHTTQWVNSNMLKACQRLRNTLSN